MSDQTNAEMKLDEILENYKVTPMSLCLYLLEQYILEDGVKGRDLYQDHIGAAWHSLLNAEGVKR